MPRERRQNTDKTEFRETFATLARRDSKRGGWDLGGGIAKACGVSGGLTSCKGPLPPSAFDVIMDGARKRGAQDRASSREHCA